MGLITKTSSEVQADEVSQKSTYDPDSEVVGLVKCDPWLEPYSHVIRSRTNKVKEWIDRFSKEEGGFDQVTKGYERYGLHVFKEGVTYREWAPNAISASLIGDFNRWDPQANPMEKDEFGTWTVLVPNLPDGSCPIPHNSKIKISMVTPQGERIDRLPAWSRRVTQDLDVSPIYDAVFWNPPTAFIWNHDANPLLTQRKKGLTNGSLRIYEAHVGISSPDGRVGTYSEFTLNILPKISDLGYNAVQLMAIMEHAYYASFGYQVTSFFAVSSRYGTPEEFKRLVDTAHSLGLVVLLDMVHSHACNNVLDGLNLFDGSDHQYFHEGARGRHELWNSRLFNYGAYETLRFLLSNLRFYMDEYHLDGFRFDGVTSMMYQHHGIGTGFSGHYDEYFTRGVDEEGVVYLMLANKMLHERYPGCITIAEDVSGMPGLCRPTSEGGVGFDYRLAMAVPDMWIKYLKEVRDEEWEMGHLVHTLTNRRHLEKTVAYCESHDQALVGDKTIAFWLMDKEMYTHMSVLSPLSPVVDRGLALHKMIRLLTHALGGNEFGHPEWLDFPRKGNGNSFHYCRRQWHLVDDGLLRYKFLNQFDRAMHRLEQRYGWLSSQQAYVSRKHEADKLIAFDRAGLLFIFNFHNACSYPGYRVGVAEPGSYRIVLDSDAAEFGGHARVDHAATMFVTTPNGWDGRPHSIQAYLPTRTALVLARVDGLSPIITHPNPDSA
ncbi:alpha-1,4-glucan branching enzyme [Massospora cicadina]|nr:alpha-1,4-glucan branching enzyme [Massospora cicadina]